MADRNLAQLNYEIGADLSKLDLSINEANRLIKDFTVQAGKASKDGLAPLNAEIAKLTQYKENLKQIGLPTDLPDSVKRSTIALTSLNQVVQDLPFGFIGIQNNIPNLVQQFSLLSKESGGFKNALSAVGNAISGPIGLVAGVSLLSTILTTLVQKYGSLGTAFKDIFGVQKNVVDLQNQYNTELEKSVGSSAGEIANLESLGRILTNNNSTLNQRNGAYDLLKKLQPEILSGIDREISLSEQQNVLVRERIKLIANEIVLKGQQQALEKLISKNSEEAFSTLNKITTGGFFDKVGLLFKGLFQNGLQANSAISVIGDTFSKTNRETDFYTKLLDDVNLKLSEATAKINNLSTAEKERLKAQKDAKKLAEDKVKIEKKLAEEAIKIQQDTFKREDDAFKILKNAYISTLTDREKELYKIQENYENQRADLLRANIDDFSLIEQQKFEAIREVVAKYDKIALDNIQKQNDAELKLAQKQSKEIEDLFKNQTIGFEPKINIDYSKLGFSKNVVKQLNQGLKFDEIEKNAQESSKKIFEAFNGILFQPLSDLFTNLIETGKFGFKDFVNAILQQLTRLIAKLTAAAIVAGILAILTGGGSTASGAASGGASSFGAIFKSLTGFGGGVKSPSFGGVNPGGMAMNGSVNLVLRGQDLVGSINRTNSQLSRIG